MKKNNQAKFKYDPDSDVLMWETSKKRGIDHATRVANVVVHFSHENIPVLIEILEATKFITETKKLLGKLKVKEEMIGEGA